MDHLQEAYLSVYEESEVAERTRNAVKHQRSGTHGDDHAMEKESEASTAAVKKATKYKGPKVMPSMAEEVDLYDVILSHLLDEGFADTEKNAITIMANMSEEWREEILEKAQIMSVSGPGGLKHMINPNVLKLQNAAAKEAQGRRAKEQAAKEAKNTERSAQARKSSIERLNAKPGADSGDYDSGYHGDDDTSDGRRHYSLSRTNRSDRTRRASGR